ncbi:MAG TPA: insulinase family protein [Candidatus Kapabacteria bacterium]|jgi:predicted Zn-dependent peptidase
MKKILLLSTLVVLAAASFAFDASAQSNNDVQDFTSHGVHVILRSTKANQVIGAILGFEGGVAYGETSNASIAGATAGVIAESGSDKYPKEAYRDSLARLSTTIAGSGSLYHMTFTLRTIRPSFASAWNIFADVITHSHFDTLEAEKLQEQSIKAIEGRDADPGGYSSFLSDSLWKGNSPLNKVPSVAEVQNLTLADLQSYRNAQFQRSRMMLVIVGDVSRAEVEAGLAEFNLLPVGNFTWPKVPHITPVTDHFDFVPKPADFPTTYIDMRAPSADIASHDWWAERIMLELLDRKLFDEVRTKRNLSYSPQAYANGEYSNFYTAISLQSVLADSATHVVFDQIRSLQDGEVSADELKGAKEGRITTFYYVAQENLRQAQILYTDQVEAGDWKLFFEIVPQTEKVTAAEVHEAARKYLHHLSFVLLGPEGKSTRDVYHYE